MITKADIDGGQAFDWGKTSSDYGTYRPGYPESFYTLLPMLGIGTPGQDVLDLGTGTGVLARAFAKRGARVTGIDMAAEQIAMAQRLAAEEQLDVNLICSPAEAANVPEHAFDIISCGQSWLYFDRTVILPLVQAWLKPGGKLVLAHICWLPRQDGIAHASEQLVLRYNPNWSAADFPGSQTIRHEWSKPGFKLVTYHAYEEAIPFTRESWCGRFRACRGTGAALSPEDMARFDQEHHALLEQIAGETFTILHQIFLHAYTPIGT
jgi:cyclopropane fatty-acyl-phospholipid synthase-like methyltransferase